MGLESPKPGAFEKAACIVPIDAAHAAVVGRGFRHVVGVFVFPRLTPFEPEAGRFGFVFHGRSRTPDVRTKQEQLPID